MNKIDSLKFNEGVPKKKTFKRQLIRNFLASDLNFNGTIIKYRKEKYRIIETKKNDSIHVYHLYLIENEKNYITIIKDSCNLYLIFLNGDTETKILNVFVYKNQIKEEIIFRFYPRNILFKNRGKEVNKFMKEDYLNSISFEEVQKLVATYDINLIQKHIEVKRTYDEIKLR